MAEDGGLWVMSEASFRGWLDRKKPSRDIVVALAARAALRALPFTAIFNGERWLDRFGAKVAACFRITSLTWVAAVYPNRANDLAAAAADDDDAYVLVPAAYAYAYTAAGCAARAAYDAASAAIAHATAAVVAAADATAAARHVFWSAVTDDLSAIESGEALSDRPLWPGGVPYAVAENWRALIDALPSEDHWRVWIDWYEARLNGEVWSEARELDLRLRAGGRVEEGRGGRQCVDKRTIGSAGL